MASSTPMKQSSLDLNLSTKKTRKQVLLAQMDLVVPWAALVELITPYYPEGKNGRPIALGRKDIGFKSSDFTKIFQRIKREKKMEELDVSGFKEALQVLNPEMLDVMSFEKGSNLDAWIESTFKSLPKK